MNRLSLLHGAALLVLAGLLGACTHEPANLAGRMRAALTPPALVADWIIQGRNDFAIYDLRSADAFAKGHLPNAVQVDPARLQQPGIVRALPNYKTLVFYGEGDTLDAQALRPLFARGLHVRILEGGYAAWQRDVLTRPTRVATPAAAKRDAVAKFLRGESALGTPETLKELPASKYVRPATLPPASPAPTYESEGC